MGAEPKRAEDGTDGVAPAGPGRRGLLALVCGGLALTALLLLRWPPEHAYGWDESMHAALPAARMATSLAEGHPEVFTATLLDCEQYPFVFPLLLAAAHLLAGPGEAVARAADVGLLAGAAALVGLLAAALARGPRAPRLLAGALGTGLVVTSPMAQAFARTLFLEVPFLAVGSAALLAWVLRRGARRAAAADLVAGLLVAAAFFTKFNYGALLVAGLALDELIELAFAARAGRLRPALGRSLRTAAPLVLAWAWWFLLPLPGGAAEAASHRAALAGFLGGNLEMAPTGPARKALHLAAYLAPAPATALVLVLGLLGALPRGLREARARAVVLALLALAVPTALHPFHLERFWLPAGLALWPLAALGLARLAALAGRGRGRTLAGAALVALLASSTLGAPAQSLWLASRLGLVPEGEAGRTAAARVFRSWNGPLALRSVPTAGLGRGELDALLDLVGREVGPGESYGWLGLSSEVSPAVLALGLHERGGSAARLLRAGQEPIDVVPAPGAPEPDWDLGRLGEWAARFDVVFFTDPPDVKDRASRRSMRERWQRPLVQNLGYEVRRLGVVAVERGTGEPLQVGLFACRRP